MRSTPARPVNLSLTRFSMRPFQELFQPQLNPPPPSDEPPYSSPSSNPYPSHITRQPKKKREMSTSDLPPQSPDSDFADGLDSLPSSPTTTSSSALSDDDLDESDAEREWKESLQQLELLLTVIVVPYVGKYFGRKCAYWGECVDGSSLLSGCRGEEVGRAGE